MPKTAELVASHIRNRIVRNELTADEALPTEAALMEEFNISRPTLREAFRILESEGLITVRRGSRGGARAQIPSSDVAARYAGFVLQNRNATVSDVLHSRVIVESPAAGIVARRRDRVSCARELRSWIDANHPFIDEPGWEVHFHEFNRLLVSLTGNESLMLITTMLERICDSATAHYERRESDDTVRMMHRAQRARRLLADLIEAGDADAAEELWRKHLSEAGHNLAANQTNAVIDVLT